MKDAGIDHVVQKRFGFPEGSIELYAKKVATRGQGALPRWSLCVTNS